MESRFVTFRTSLLALPLLFAAAWVVAQETMPGPGANPAADPLAAAPPTDARHYSYAIGQQVGENFRQDELEIDMDSFLAGVKDAVAGAEPRYSDELCGVAVQRMMREQHEKMVKRAQAVGQEGAAFLAANAKKEGVVTLPSGLQYRVITEGTGASPKDTDTVSARYRGTFIDGKMFDESGAEPISFPVGGVIAGWTEALQLMKVGSKWQLFIPGELAYGEMGRDGIPPNATLLFDVELVGIEGQ
jgi:FKBP-type peptidyl-prolyl cis-trans isomerase FklB